MGKSALWRFLKMEIKMENEAYSISKGKGGGGAAHFMLYCFSKYSATDISRPSCSFSNIRPSAPCSVRVLTLYTRFLLPMWVTSTCRHIDCFSRVLLGFDDPL